MRQQQEIAADNRKYGSKTINAAPVVQRYIGRSFVKLSGRDVDFSICNGARGPKDKEREGLSRAARLRP